MDRRAIYTRNTIKDSFLSCVKDTGFGKVTVTKICKKADINRSTFYLHFDRVDDVLDDVLKDMVSNIGTMYEKYRETSSRKSCRYPLCQFIRKSEKYHCLFLDNSLSEYIIEKLSLFMKDSYISTITEKENISKEEGETIFYFQIHGCFAAALRNLNKTDEQWARMQRTIDLFLWKNRVD